MRWGKGAPKPKSIESHKLWFAWYPVRVYEGRYMWWEWCYVHRDEWGWVHYEVIFGGKKPQ